MSDPFASGRRFDLGGLRVFIAIPTHRDFHPETVIAIVRTQEELLRRGIPVTTSITYNGSLIHHVRSKVAWEFLKSDCNRLFWVDSDMQWEPKDFIRLLALSTEMSIVAGAYPAKQEPIIFLGRAAGDMEANRHGCLPVDGFGMGFCCMDRKVIEDAAAAAPMKRFHQLPDPIPHTFFLPGEEVDDGKGAEGEDMAFFARAKAQGHQLWVDPSIELGHIGSRIYRGRLLDTLVRTEAASAAA